MGARKSTKSQSPPRTLRQLSPVLRSSAACPNGSTCRQQVWTTAGYFDGSNTSYRKSDQNCSAPRPSCWLGTCDPACGGKSAAVQMNWSQSTRNIPTARRLAARNCGTARKVTTEITQHLWLCDCRHWSSYTSGEKLPLPARMPSNIPGKIRRTAKESTGSKQTRESSAARSPAACSFLGRSRQTTRAPSQDRTALRSSKTRTQQRRASDSEKQRTWGGTGTTTTAS